MSDIAQREMTLREIVERLPTGTDGIRQIRHVAFIEYQILQDDIAKLTHQRDELQAAYDNEGAKALHYFEQVKELTRQRDLLREALVRMSKLAAAVACDHDIPWNAEFSIALLEARKALEETKP